MGKYLAMLTVFAVPTAIACLCPLIIALNGSSFLLADYGTILPSSCWAPWRLPWDC